MKPIHITPANIPALAYSDGTRYYCLEWDCYRDRAQLKECGAIPSTRDYYTPILRCSECGRLYFGNPTPLQADDEATTAHEEERNATIRADEETTRAEEEEQNGDIILPHLLTV